MSHVKLILSACGAILLLSGTAGAQQEIHSSEQWTVSWETAQSGRNTAMPDWARPPESVMQALSKIPSPLRPVPETISNQTVRMITRPGIGGSALRVQLSNVAGSTPLVVGSAHVGRHDKGSSIVAGSDHALTFGGRASFEIPAGAVVVSDRVNMRVEALSELAVSLYIPGNVQTETVHTLGLHATYIGSGDVAGMATFPQVGSNASYFWLSGIEVLAAHSAAIAALGDSITDGFMTTPDSWNTWPDQLTEKLRARKSLTQWVVVNAGISGNRVRLDGAGPNAVARFDRDVLGEPGVQWVILFEGINDINVNGFAAVPGSETSNADTLIGAYEQIIETAHTHGIRVMGATLMPCEGLFLYSPKTEALRQKINDWIRNSRAFDAVADLDLATRDPERPTRLRPEFDSGDHIHPNDAGTLAIANRIDIGVFQVR